MQAARGTPLSPEGADPDGKDLDGKDLDGTGPQGATEQGATEQGATEQGAKAPPARKRQVPVLIAVALFVLAADQISKALVVANMPTRGPIRLLGGFLTVTLIRNPGAAFNIGTSYTIVFTVIAVGVVVFIARAARNLRSVGWAITLGLLLGGALGNLSDRLFRSPGLFRGTVVDWIQLPHWPVFNLGDSAITCGGVLVVLLSMYRLRLDGTREEP